MGSVNISLITVSFNAAGTIQKCIGSVIRQRYPNIQYIVIDAGSTDGTMAIVNNYTAHISHIISEPDNGIYDGMNKGIALANGDIIGILNADDYFANDDILSEVACAFESTGTDIVYGDIDYVDNHNRIIRKWRTGKYKPGDFNYGWMPPHPSFYARRYLFNNYGGYDLQYGTAADYELMLRLLHTHNIKTYYLNKVMVKMLVGGVSNITFGNRVATWRNDFKAMRNHQLPFPYISLLLKPLRKIIQYIG